MKRRLFGQMAATALVSIAIGAGIATPASAVSQSQLTVEQAVRKIVPQQVRQIVSPFQQWVIGANSTGHILPKAAWNIRPDRNYSIKGLKLRKFLQYESQKFGINLGWTNDASAATEQARAKWFFARASSSDAPIRYGERIAIGWGKSRSFLTYSKRTVGINLDWSSKPAYEWIIGGGKNGTAVNLGRDHVMIFNMKHGEPLMYFNRTAGGHIGWPDSQTWLDAAGDFAKQKGVDYAKEFGKAAILIALSSL